MLPIITQCLLLVIAALFELKCQKFLQNDYLSKSYHPNWLKLPPILGVGWPFVTPLIIEWFFFSSLDEGVFFYLLYYITSTEFFRSAIAKKDMDPIYHNFYIVYWSWVKFQNNWFFGDFWWGQNEQFCGSVRQNPFFFFFEIPIFQIGG